MGTNLGDLLKGAGLASSPESEKPAEPEAEAAEQDIVWGPKVVLRYTKKGRGGRTVTLVQGVVEGQEKLCKQLRKELGVGTRVEDEDVVVQGNQVKRLTMWIESQGVKKVVVG